MIECPNCRTEYFIKPRNEETQDEEIMEEEEPLTDELEEGNL